VHATVLIAALARWPSHERRRLSSPPVWFVVALVAGLVVETVIRTSAMDPDAAAWVRTALVGSFSVLLLWNRLRRPLIPSEGGSS
jgi:hypothetical protein